MLIFHYDTPLFFVAAAADYAAIDTLSLRFRLLLLRFASMPMPCHRRQYAIITRFSP